MLLHHPIVPPKVGWATGTTDPFFERTSDPSSLRARVVGYDQALSRAVRNEGPIMNAEPSTKKRSDAYDSSEQRWHPTRWKLVRVLGISAIIAGGLAIAAWLLVAALLLGPFIFWLSWNVLDLGPAVGLPELGFWAIVLATLFLVVGWFGKVAITGLVFLIDPDWLSAEATVRWPEPTVKNFVAIALLAVLAATPHAHDRWGTKDSS